MKLATSNQQRPAVLRENAPILVIIATILVIGTVAIGVWYYLNSQQDIDQFKNKVNGLVKNVNEKPVSKKKSDSEDTNAQQDTKPLAAKSSPFNSPLEKLAQEKSETKSGNGDKQAVKGKTTESVKKRIAAKVKVLGLLGGPGKRLAIIEVGKDVQIVKPGDRISSLIIKDINQKRLIAEEYGKEITYTFGGGQD